MRFYSIILLCFFCTKMIVAQDTFSIVAVDSITGEVGSAGASCVDLFQTGFSSDDFLGVLIPGVGAINTQAYYLPANQNNATSRMQLGDTPSQIIDWLISNDIQSQPQLRQYGIAAFVEDSPQTAAHTGNATDDYKNHIIGPNYTIQGNILLGQAVLDSMEARFLNEPGNLACKLMAALQGANVVGADSRCSSNGTSSLFAYVKVAQESDEMGDPSFLVSVRTHQNAGIEPIDSLQIKFDEMQECNSSSSLEEQIGFDQFFSVFPNPSSTSLTIQNKTSADYKIQIIDISGTVSFTDEINDSKVIDTSNFASGTYIIQLTQGNKSYTKKILIQ